MFTIPISQNPIFQYSIIPIVSEANYVLLVSGVGCRCQVAASNIFFPWHPTPETWTLKPVFKYGLVSAKENQKTKHIFTDRHPVVRRYGCECFHRLPSGLQCAWNVA